ncbi:MAG: peptidoglycan editing factor PgeF, partial [Ignavibacteria bacterium]
TEAGLIKENDALITNQTNLFLVVTIADCIPILFYDHKNKIVGAVHSGWRGTYSKILFKTIEYCKKELDLSNDQTYFYFGPSICKNCFEVDEDVAEKFDKHYVKKRGKKFLVDLQEINRKYLLDFGFKKENIQVSKLCTFELSSLFHSYRRDKENSGRMFGVIGLV